jgi:hypothetical protein
VNRSWKGIASAVAVVVALGYVLHGLWQDRETAAAALHHLHWAAIVSSLVPALAMLACSTSYHVLLLRALEQPPPPAGDLVRSYATAQLVRYLPGKIWSVLHQSATLAGVARARSVIAANVLQYVITTGLAAAVVIVGAMVVATGEAAWWWLLLPVCLALAALHGRGRMLHVTRSLARRLSLGRLELPVATLPRSSALRLAALLVLEWIAYALLWAVFCRGSTYTAHVVPLALAYAGSAGASALLMLAPGGLALREALFVWSGSRLGLETGELAVIGLVMRVVLLAAECAQAAGSWLLRAPLNRSGRG